jgi:hypothetical protein
MRHLPRSLASDPSREVFRGSSAAKAPLPVKRRGSHAMAERAGGLAGKLRMAWRLSSPCSRQSLAAIAPLAPFIHCPSPLHLSRRAELAHLRRSPDDDEVRLDYPWGESPHPSRESFTPSPLSISWNHPSTLRTLAHCGFRPGATFNKAIQQKVERAAACGCLRLAVAVVLLVI